MKKFPLVFTFIATLVSPFPQMVSAGAAQHCVEVQRLGNNHKAYNNCSHSVVIFFCMRGNTCGRNNDSTNPFYTHSTGIAPLGSQILYTQGNGVSWAVCDGSTSWISSDAGSGNFGCHN